MGVIEMLSHQGDGSLGLVGVLLGHVQVIYKVDKLAFASGSEASSSLLLELRLKDTLEEGRVSEEIEIDSLRFVVLSGGGELVEETINDLSFTTSGVSDKHRCDSNSDEVLHDVLGGDCVRRRNCVVSNGSASVDAVLYDVAAEVVPVHQLGVLSIYVVIEDGSLGGEFDGLELLTPELIESESALVTFLDLKSSSHAPDSGENEDELESFNFVLEHDDL